MFDTDVFVLGGGPAGLAAAIAARGRGLRVVLADGDHPPIDKACGEGLMPDSIAAAGKLGIDVPPDGGFPFRGIRFAGTGGTVSALFPEGTGLGVRRTVLHPMLVEQAARCGVEMLWDTPCSGIEGHTARLQSRAIRARWMVGADGVQSSVRRWAGLEEFREPATRFGFRRHYEVAPWSEFVEIHWADGCQFYVTPVSASEVCVVLMSRDPHLRPGVALPRFAELSERLRSARVSTAERGSPASTRRLRRVTRGHVALIGDASGTVDAITGEGLCLAFQQAVALGAALEAGDLGLYERRHASIARRPVFMARTMLLLDRWPALRARTLRALSGRPDLFTNLLAMHVGRLNPGQFAATAATLGWEVAIQ